MEDPITSCIAKSVLTQSQIVRLYQPPSLPGNDPLRKTRKAWAERMAATLPPVTFKNGFSQPARSAAWEADDNNITEGGEEAHFLTPPSEEPFTSSACNSLGTNVLRTWPTLYNGTESPQGAPDWWRPSNEVDVLICGAGAFGLEVGLSLVRQGITFRIIDKAEGPLLAGRADAVHPRAIELIHSWGLGFEFTEEGPLMDHTALYKNGKRLSYRRTYQSDSRYRGVHVITQGQAERVYIRDLLRHRTIVERSTVVEDFEVQQDPSIAHPVRAIVQNKKTGMKQTVLAKFLVGADGACSSIRKKLNIPFDGTTTDIYWAIMDCKFATDYPTLTQFGVVMNAEHGGCIIVPREDGYTRIYTQVDAKRAKVTAQDGLQNGTHPICRKLGESGVKVDNHSLTVEDVLDQTNKIFAPYKLSFTAPMSWFAVWKISERVARSFSSPDLRVHIGGDASHVHSVLGGFGLNSSIYDASNLGWKLGLCAQNRANLSALLSTYDLERRLFANRVIRVSGAYLRFVCNSKLPLAELRGLGEELETCGEELPILDGTTATDLKFLGAFFARNDKFLLGLDPPWTTSSICPPEDADAAGDGMSKRKRPTVVRNGRRAPNPRVAFSQSATGYLYDKITGAARFHILVFGSDLAGLVHDRLARFSQQALTSPTGFFHRFGAADVFNVVLVTKALPFETEGRLSGDELEGLRKNAEVVFDDRPPDEDAHGVYEINHARGAVVVVRPDLWIGVCAWPEEAEKVLGEYFGGFLVGRPVPGVPGMGFEEG